MLAKPLEQIEKSDVERRTLNCPQQPRTVEDTGLGFLFVTELITKILLLRGQLRLVELSEQICLPGSVLEPILAFMRTERLCEVGRTHNVDSSIAYSLTDLGRQRGQEFLLKSQYVGPAPVPINQYVEHLKKQSIAQMSVKRDNVAQAFRGIITQDGLLQQFGAAMNSGRAIFVYGPAGSGKTFISEHLVNLLTGAVAIPHAIEIDSEVIQIFDPLTHKPVFAKGEAHSSLDRRAQADARWVMCERPVVITGGELTLSMLDLDFDERARFYQAPPQVKANNGLLIIDDLGRQLVSALDLMNRWIVPLDRHVDYLALHTGKKFMIPFDVIVIFSTNMPPKDLADEAFLRRLGYKIYIGEMDEKSYRGLIKQVCDELRLPHDKEGVEYLLDLHRRNNKPLLACIPRDILKQMMDISMYEGTEPGMTKELLDWAWHNYFSQEYQKQQS
jgi:hypothetical protein